MVMAATRNVLIHVFDEYRKTAKDFVCPRDVLLEKMKYFRAYLNQSNEQDEIDISVHCDVEIFEWLVEYMQQCESEGRPRISLENIASIMVSSEFLQMDALVEECVLFIASRMQEFLQLRVDFACLSDNTITKIAENCSAEKLQQLQDPKDKILSKLLRKKLEAMLADLQARNLVLSSCVNCDAVYLGTDEARLHCSRGTRKLTVHGELIAVHCAKVGWAAEDWARGLVQEKNLTWGAVYWFIWASTKCFHCTTCRRYSCLLDLHECAYHPGAVIGVGSDAKFTCCGTRIFFGGDFDGVGCKTRDHTVSAVDTPEHFHKNVEALGKHWEMIAAGKKIILPDSLERRTPAVDMSVVLAAVRPPLPEPAPAELEAALKKLVIPTADATPGRQRAQWETLRLQEHDRTRMQLLTKRLIQLRKNQAT